MGVPRRWDEVTILTAIVEFYERERHWPALHDFRPAQGLPSLPTVYQQWGTPATARQWAFWSLVCDDPLPADWQILTSDY
jgi:hypothetical protein